MSDAKTVRENIARARIYIQRQDLVAAMRTLSAAMSQYADIKAAGVARFEVEEAIRVALDECNRQSRLREVLTPAGGTAPAQLRYVRGKEGMLARVFAGLAVSLENTHRQLIREKEQQWLERRQRLAGKAQEFLESGELHKGLAFIRRVLAEYGNSDPDLHLSMAEYLRDADLDMDAAEVLSQAIELFPKAAVLYAASMKLYAAIGRLDKVEGIFRRGLRQFGTHPRNLLAMARIYAEAGQRAKAVSLLYRLLQEHPDCEEAKTLLGQVEFRQ